MDPDIADIEAAYLDNQIDSLFAATNRDEAVARARALVGSPDALLAALGKRTREAVERCQRIHAGRESADV